MSKPVLYFILTVTLIICSGMNDEAIAQQQISPAENAVNQAGNAIGNNLSNLEVRQSSNTSDDRNEDGDFPVSEMNNQNVSASAMLDQISADSSNANLQIYLEQRQSYHNEHMALFRAMPSINRNQYQNLRQLFDNAYELGRLRILLGSTEYYSEIVSDLDYIVSKFENREIPVELSLPFVQYYYLKALVDRESGIFVDNEFYFNHIERLTLRRLSVHADYWPLTRFRYYILTDSDYRFDMFSSQANWDEACAIMREVDRLAENSVNQYLAECSFYQYDILKSAGNSLNANKALLSVQSILSNERAFHDNYDQEYPLWYILSNVRLQGERRGSVLNSINNENLKYRNISDSNYFTTVSMLFNVWDMSVPTMEDIEYFRLIYNNYFRYSGEYPFSVSNSSVGNNVAPGIFENLAESFARGIRTFPRSRTLSSLHSHSLSRAMLARLREADASAVNNLIERNLQLINPATSLSSDRIEFYERGIRVCYPLSMMFRSAIAEDDRALIERAYALLDQHCGTSFRRFPWDLFARVTVTDAAARFGRYLHRHGDSAAAEPYLVLASNWGIASATNDRIAILEDRMSHPDLGQPSGQSGATELDTAALLDRLRTLARRQTVESFSIPVTGANSSTLEVYVMQFGEGNRCPVQLEPLPRDLECYGVSGIDDQILWHEQVSGAFVRDEISGAFGILDRIATQNDVSFTALAQYTLGQNREFQDKLGNSSSTLDRTTIISASTFATSVDLNESNTADIISASSTNNCYGWDIRLAPMNRIHGITEELILPAIPQNYPGVGTNSTVFNGGQRIVTELVKSVETGQMSHSWCFAEGDPLGTYRFIIRHGDEELANLTFELVE